MDTSTIPAPTNTPTASLFLAALFPRELLGDGELVCLSYPDSFVNELNQIVNYYRKLPATKANLWKADNEPQGWLYGVSTVIKPPRGEKLRQRAEDVLGAFVLVCDDVGTKAKEPPVLPTYILETSPGNYQWGYALDPVDVSDPVTAAHFDGCTMGLAVAGYNDAGCRSATRVVKLPGAVHKSGFITRVAAWNPERSWDLDELMAELGVEPAKQRVRHAQDPNYVGVALDNVDDLALDWLNSQGLTTGLHNDQWVHLWCPWEDEHNNPGAEPGSATSYSPLNYGVSGRQFHCRHEHCARRGLRELAQYIQENGGPSLVKTTAPNVPEQLARLFGEK